MTSASQPSASRPARAGPARPGRAVKLARGESCFVSAADGPLRARGPARLFLAAPGAPSPA